MCDRRLALQAACQETFIDANMSPYVASGVNVAGEHRARLKIAICAFGQRWSTLLMITILPNVDSTKAQLNVAISSPPTKQIIDHNLPGQNKQLHILFFLSIFMFTLV